MHPGEWKAKKSKPQGPAGPQQQQQQQRGVGAGGGGAAAVKSKQINVSDAFGRGWGRPVV